MPKKTTDESSNSVVISLRIHPKIRDEIDELIPSFANDPTFAPSGDTSRADVVRYLVIKGLEAIKGDR